jgi:hypothetical protein
MWAKRETLNEAIIIGSEENSLYKLKGHSEATMTHAIEKSCELWHRILAHINYKALPYICKVVIGLPELKGDMKAYAMDVHKVRTSRTHFRRETTKQKES